MASYTREMICNMALVHAKSAGLIESLDDDTGTGADLLRLWYEPAKFEALEANDWRFARVSQTLGTHADAAPINRWQYRYTWPANCIAPRLIENPAGPDEPTIPFDVELSEDGTTKTILTDQAEAVLIYTQDVSNPALFSAHFVTAMSYLLAHRIAPGLTGKRGNTGDNYRAYERAILVAGGMEANQSKPRPAPESERITARY